MTSKERFLRIGFLKWARLVDADVKGLSCGDGLVDVFLSPDVNSLHIVWVDCEGNIGHEIADYDNRKSVRQFLDEQVGDDSWEYWEAGEDDLMRLLDDYGEGLKKEDIPAITISELERRHGEPVAEKAQCA